MEFKPLNKLGMVMGYDLFGVSATDAHRAGLDPDRYGAGVQVFRLNDIYLSTVPCEAPSEQGLYIRARTSDTKHMYNAYGNASFYYYTWGRWFDIQHYESGALQPLRLVPHGPGDHPRREHPRAVGGRPAPAGRHQRRRLRERRGPAGPGGCLGQHKTRPPPSSNWNAAADCNSDGYVNVGDLQLLVAHWGEHL